MRVVLTLHQPIAPVSRRTEPPELHLDRRIYDQLLAITPTPVVAMNRAIALAEVRGPQPALDILDGLDLAGYHLFHATRADLLRRLGRHGDASEAYALAVNVAASQPERTFLIDRLETAQAAG